MGGGGGSVRIHTSSKQNSPTLVKIGEGEDEEGIGEGIEVVDTLLE